VKLGRSPYRRCYPHSYPASHRKKFRLGDAFGWTALVAWWKIERANTRASAPGRLKQKSRQGISAPRRLLKSTF